MRIVDRGQGDPLLLIPGLQGRWEYFRPAVEALASSFRVITFSLCDEPAAGAPCDAARGLDAFADHAVSVMDELDIDRATLCGISLGGVVALRCAARHPDRVKTLVMASAPGPYWHLRRRHEMYARLPWLFGPLFLVETPFRLRREIAVAIPDRRDRWRFVAGQLKTVLRARVSTARMAARALMIASPERVHDCAKVAAPTLVVHGEPALDHVVHVAGTLAYGELIRNARVVVLERTGHLGSITRPRAFAALVREFVTGDRRIPRNATDDAA